MIELNQIYNMDCLEGLKLMKDRSVDMVLCDLPYGETQNEWDEQIDINKLWKQYLRICKPNAPILLFAKGMFEAELKVSQKKLWKYDIVWIKSKATNFLNVKYQPLRKHEDIILFNGKEPVLVFYDKQPIYNPQMSTGKAYDKGLRKDQLTGSYGDFKQAHIKSEGSRYPTDVIYCPTAESEGPVWHPTQKPVKLCEYFIKTYSNENAVVLDNCMGSGATAVGCVNTNRQFIGFDINPEYVEKANKRIDTKIKRLDDFIDIKIEV